MADALYEAGGPVAVSPITFAGTVMNSALGEVARRWQLKGASSFIAGDQPLCYAYDLLRAELANVVLCGGAEEVREVHEWAYRESARRDHSEVMLEMGQGSACAVLENRDHALARGARPIAEVLGWGSVRDIEASMFPLTRSAEAIEAAMRDALRDGGLSAIDVTHVVRGANNLPGTRAPEQAAIDAIFAESLCCIDTKAAAGETFGASGPLAAVAGVATLRRATGNAVCAINSIHSGGMNCTVVLSTAGLAA